MRSNKEEEGNRFWGQLMASVFKMVSTENEGRGKVELSGRACA